MNLAELDGKCVRITDESGDHFDGICAFDSAEFCEHEFGRREAALEIMDTLFFAGDIDGVEILEDEGGEFGRFRDAYGALERLVVEDGEEAILDALGFDGAEPEHAARLIRCLADDRGAVTGEIEALLQKLAAEGDEPIVREAAKAFFESAEDGEPYVFRVISNQVRFGCGYRTLDGKRQYFAWHGVPDRNDDYFTTTEITKEEYERIGEEYPFEIVADRATADVFRSRYIEDHPVLLEGWSRLL